MKNCFLPTIFCTALNLLVAARGFERPILKLQSSYVRLSVTPGEKMFLATKAGEVAYANTINDDWHIIPLNDKENQTAGATIDNINFFNSDTGFVSGFIYNHGKYNIIYHTANGGRSWQKVNFQEDGWADDAISLDNGEAWMSISGKGICYTSDYGFNWKTFMIPDKKQRFAATFFNSKHEGIIGSLWNMLAVTSDNCRNWRLIPTPLDQLKYNKTNKQSRPEINKVLIYGNYFICQQEDLVFYSKRDSINWVPLNEYTNVFTDPQNTALFLLNKKGSFVKTNEKLEPAKTFDELMSAPSAYCRNGNLFVLSGKTLLKISAEKAEQTKLYTNDLAAAEYKIIGYDRRGTYGCLENNLYLQETYNGEWKLTTGLPFNTSNGSTSLNGEIIIYDNGGDSIAYYNLPLKKLSWQKRNDIIADFFNSGIRLVALSQGSSGCFHRYSDNLIYERNGDVFETEGISPEGTSHKTRPSNFAESIVAAIVDSFASKVPAYLWKQASLSDLGFISKDFDRCKSDIRKFENSLSKKQDYKPGDFYLHENNIDFSRLVSLVDSVKEVDSAILSTVLYNFNDFYSTTTNFKMLTLTNYDGVELNIRSNYYSENPFNLPWIISTKGFNAISTATGINDFIKKLDPYFLMKKTK